MKIPSRFVVIGLSLLILLSCGTDYVPSQLSHTYVTNTQQHHQPTGIVISNKGGMGSLGASMALVGRAYFVKVLVDGREAFKAVGLNDVESFVQIPDRKSVV